LDAFVAILKSMLAHLRDLHVWIEHRGEFIGSYRLPWKANFNVEVALNQLAEKTRIGPFALVGTTQSDGFGYLLVTRQSSATPLRVQRTVAEIGKRRKAPGFIVDLRVGCHGGDERLAQLLAQVFCPQEVIYAKHKYRIGRCYDDFGRIHTRTLGPAGQPYTRPVVCLIGQGCMSSGEALVKMLKALPQVTTIGERTRGSSGNPKPYALRGLGIRVWFSRWVDLNPNGHPFEGRGIRPEISISLPVTSYRNQDPTLERALCLLQRKVARAISAALRPQVAEDRWNKNLNGKRTP
jgi:C-terminal processing protease CtpA/Prc